MLGQTDRVGLDIQRKDNLCLCLPEALRGHGINPPGVWCYHTPGFLLSVAGFLVR